MNNISLSIIFVYIIFQNINTLQREDKNIKINIINIKKVLFARNRILLHKKNS